jgi:hypothetical protein
MRFGLTYTIHYVALPSEYETLSTTALHEKFRSIISLTELISAINNSGHPTLREHDDQRKRPTESLWEKLLAAITHILVRHEVVAVAVSGSSIVAVQEQNVEVTGDQPNATDEDVTRDEPDAADTEDPGHAGGDGTGHKGPRYGDHLTQQSSSDLHDGYTQSVHHDDLLDATANIQLRDEGVATTVSIASKQEQEAKAITGQLDTAGEPDVADAEELSDDRTDTEGLQCGNRAITRITAIVNPRPEYTKRWGLQFPDSSEIKVVDQGESYLPPNPLHCLSPDELCESLIKKIP